MQLGLVKVKQWVEFINEIMNVNSCWVVLKSNHFYQRNG